MIAQLQWKCQIKTQDMPSVVLPIYKIIQCKRKKNKKQNRQPDVDTEGQLPVLFTEVFFIIAWFPLMSQNSKDKNCQKPGLDTMYNSWILAIER